MRLTTANTKVICTCKQITATSTVLFVIFTSRIAITFIAHNRTNHQFIALLKLPLIQQGSTGTPLPISDIYHREKCVGLNPNIHCT